MMNVIQTVEIIKRRFAEIGHKETIPLLKGGHFIAELTHEGVSVDNLGNQPLLPWAVFQEAVCVLIQNDGHAERGDAMGSKLGDEGLPLDSIEGHIAQVVYGKRPGETVFRRITPIACILIWAGICEAGPHELILRMTRE
ncbi:MAG: hypothetical protein A2W42_03060 [Candidatus Muproteobacteria bacterium RIFCSPHIGHO2_01_60_12]|nr:MAG: hypothetical protein A2W42_03060 [Candidatus Muproteobacteria bacterium RIFCSPHIGHO2_01_60_12]